MLFFSPAKVNLYFRVICKRKDGYHDISSLFHTVNYGDFLTVQEKKGEDLYSSTEPSLKWDSSNLIFQAVDLFRLYTQRKFAVAIHLEKKIPLQAGLGGGSSNAATLLWALNELSGQILSLEELKRLGAKLGSDVPFFFSHGQAVCEGRGEKITPVKQDPLEFWIVKPSFGINTKEVFTRYTPSNEAFQKKNFHNDLEEAAFSLEPRLLLLKETLLQKADKVVMTGSGSAFLVFTKEDLSFIASFSQRVKSITRKKTSWYTASASS